MSDKIITILSNKKEVSLSSDLIRYVYMHRNTAEIHTSTDQVYTTRMTLHELEQKLGNEFIKIHRSCLVSARMIHIISDKIHLNNGETLEYPKRKRKELNAQFSAIKKDIVQSFADSSVPLSEEEYHNYYKSFDNLPFAFTDIEMIFDDNQRTVDWIFRYGNNALAKLENTPLDKLIGNSFKSIFGHKDSKWLKSYEFATLYGEKREIIDYSPELDKYLKVFCFPTFPGHCGCILLDIKEVKFTKNSSDAEKALMLYFGKLPNNNP